MALSLDEALGMSLVDEADESIHVDIDTRQVTIPESQQVFGVESDEDVEVKHIVIDGRYNDGTDLSTFTFRVNYQNANGDKGTYLATELKVNDDSIEFDWVIGRQVVAYKGTIVFIVCAYTIDSSSVIQNEWNSTLGKGTTLEGLEVSEFDFGDDIVRQLASILSDVNAAQTSAKASADEAYKSKTEVVALGKEQQAAIEKKGKDTLASIPDNYTQVSNDVSQLKEATAKLKDGKISKFYASSQGNTNLPDSDDGRIMDLMLYGKSEQKQYSGKNLWSFGDITTATESGIPMQIPAGTYTLTRVGTGNLSLRFYWGTTDGESVLIKVGESTQYQIQLDHDINTINFNVGGFSAPIKNIQLEKGSTATDYEPYVGGIPSPNPEYPQEIKSVVNPVVKVTGKNLLKTIHWETQTVSGVTIEKTSDTVFKISGTATGDVNVNSSWGQGINVPAQSYLLCKILHGSCPAGSKVIFFTSSYNSISSEIDGVSPLQTSALACGLVRFFIKKGSNINCTVGLSIQMDTSTDYKPYTETVASLPYTLNAIPVTSGGNVTIDGQQYIADYIDAEKGKLVQRVLKYKVTGDEDIYAHASGWIYASFGIAVVIELGLSNVARLVSSQSQLLTGSYIRVGAEGGYFTYNDIFTDVDAFKTYAKNHDLYVFAVLKEPAEIDLTSDEVTALKALASYYPVTNVSTTSDQLDGYTVFDYPISLANGWNYVKQQLGDTRDYLYGIDLMTAEAYVNSEYAAALAEIEV